MKASSNILDSATGRQGLSPEDSIATRQSLLKRLRNKEDEEGWQEFFDLYWGLIYRVGRGAGLSDADAQDVVQETVISVARKIDGFVYNPQICSFKTWMLRLTRWRITDRLRDRQRDAARMHVSFPSEAPTRTGTLERVPDPHADALSEAWDREWRENLLQTALERVRRRVSPDYYQVYDYCVHDQLPSREVAKLLGINIAKVYLARHRVQRMVKQELENLHRQIQVMEQVRAGGS